MQVRTETILEDARCGFDWSLGGFGCHIVLEQGTLKAAPRDTRLIGLVKTLIAEAAREDAQQAGVQPVRLQLPWGLRVGEDCHQECHDADAECWQHCWWNFIALSCRSLTWWSRSTPLLTRQAAPFIGNGCRVREVLQLLYHSWFASHDLFKAETFQFVMISNPHSFMLNPQVRSTSSWRTLTSTWKRRRASSSLSSTSQSSSKTAQQPKHFCCLH